MRALIKMTNEITSNMVNSEQPIDSNRSSNLEEETAIFRKQDDLDIVLEKISLQVKEGTDDLKQQKDVAPAISDGSSKNKQAILWTILGAAAALALIVGLSVGLAAGRTLELAPTFSVSLATVSPKTLQTNYASCSELRADLLQASGFLANSVIDANAQWYFHRKGVNFNDQAKDGNDLDVAETLAHDPDSSSSLPDESNEVTITENSFGTNNQVDGVEEADIVQSDGEKVYAAYGLEIVVLRAADNVTALERIQVPEVAECYSQRISSLLLVSQKLIVTTSGYCDSGLPYGQVVAASNNTRVFIYNTGTAINLELTKQSVLQGDYISARAIGDENVHIVTSSWLNTRYAFTQYLDPYNENVYDQSTLKDETEFRTQAHFQAAEQQETFVDQFIFQLGDCTTLQQVALWQSSNSTILDFSSIMQSLSSVYSFSVQEEMLENSIHQASMILPTSNWQVYASQDRLIVASEGWFVDAGGDDDAIALQQTYLVTYQLHGPVASAVSLGTVPGYVLNQFSIDHYYSQKDDNSYLRIATSSRDQWTWNSHRRWTRSVDGTSQVTIFEMNQDNDRQQLMIIVGQLIGLGKPGERIYSVRFQGDRAFVVTFRETDPFYTLDLSDPINPRAIGELEIPGFSNYLHPISIVGDASQQQDLILGVGQNADEATGRISGLQISLFNVSDFANPQRIQNYVEKGGYSSSEAQYDHKAFRYLEESQILILPLTVYARNDDDAFDGFRLYKIDPKFGIAPYFSITHSSSLYSGCWSRSHLDARSMVFGGDILTLKGHSILSHDLTTKLEDTDPINLDENLTTGCALSYFE